MKGRDTQWGSKARGNDYHNHVELITNIMASAELPRVVEKTETAKAVPGACGKNFRVTPTGKVVKLGVPIVWVPPRCLRRPSTATTPSLPETLPRKPLAEFNVHGHFKKELKEELEEFENENLTRLRCKGKGKMVEQVAHHPSHLFRSNVSPPKPASKTRSESHLKHSNRAMVETRSTRSSPCTRKQARGEDASKIVMESGNSSSQSSSNSGHNLKDLAASLMNGSIKEFVPAFSKQNECNEQR